MGPTSSILRKLIHGYLAEGVNTLAISEAPITFHFEEDKGTGREGGFNVLAMHPGFKKSVGTINVLPHWDGAEDPAYHHDDYIMGLPLAPKPKIKGREVEIYQVDSAWLDRRFRGEGLGKQMYKFLIAHLSRMGIALVPGEWTRNENPEFLTLFPPGTRGTSHDALRVWRGLDIPAFYPEWNPEDFSEFRSTRRRGWLDRTSNKKRNDRQYSPE